MNTSNKILLYTLSSVLSMAIGYASYPENAEAQQKNTGQTTVEPQNNVPANPEATSASYGDWVLRCQKADPKQSGNICEIGHSVIVDGQNGPILQLAIGKTPKGQTRKLVVILPANVSLSQAPQVEVDSSSGDRKTTAWLRCLPMACFADVDLDSLNWKATQAGKVSYSDAGNRPVTVPFSLKGLDRALAALGE